ncbi:MAG: 16S rRNA (adenine1518-N6/adenine1519-N6)-dimethyltransferase [Gammaproteobacteria bacterium]|jgi:16S rRNA (adenine1518-N6/adenine1519-N6)-dimethyltransferase
MTRDRFEHQPRKRFGQHFLHDDSVIEQIVAAINVQANDRVVEIGPGKGALTRALLKVTDTLHAIELDRDLVAYLAVEFDPTRLVVHQGDALTFDIATLAAPDMRLRVVGNLPYNISTPLMFHLLKRQNLLTDMHFMLQLEVVNRLAAAPDEPDYGRLSVMTQLHCEVQPLLRVRPGSFTPPPKVESAVVRLRPRAHMPLPAEHLPVFSQLVAAAFSQRRKTLRNALKNLMPAAQIEAAGIDPGRRPGTVSVPEFVTLSSIVHQHLPEQGDGAGSVDKSVGKRGRRSAGRTGDAT